MPNQIPLAVGKKVSARVRRADQTWSEFTQRLALPTRSPETMADYLDLDTSGKLEIKSLAGYYVPARIHGQTRRRDKVGPRRILTLDIDDGSPELFDVLRRDDPPGWLARTEYVLHTTKSHVNRDRPRYRVVFLLDREIGPEEHGPLSRIVGLQMVKAARKAGASDGFKSIDPVSHRPAQVCFWPVVSSDQEFVFHPHYGDPLPVDRIIEKWSARHGSIFNLDALPAHPSETHLHTHNIKQQDPLQKNPPVGSWCRAYPDIRAVIDKFLSDFYEPTEDPDRYRNAKGSGAAGVVIYDDKFLYSFHSTDPCSGQLCNAWDAVRLCLFGHKDKPEHEDVPPPEKPSYKAMLAWATQDERFAAQFNRDRFEREALPDDTFTDDDIDPEAAGGVSPAPTPAPPPDGDVTYVTDDDDDDDDGSWTGKLAITAKGGLRANSFNAHLIIENAKMFRGLIGFDTRSGREVWTGARTVRIAGSAFRIGAERGFRGAPFREIKDSDIASIRLMISAGPSQGGFGVDIATAGIVDAVSIVARRNPVDRVKGLFDSLPDWDGEPRIDGFLSRVINGPEATYDAYLESVSKILFSQIVTRALNPGCLADAMVIFSGEQGCGKSTLAQALAFERPFTGPPEEFGKRKLFVEYTGALNNARDVFEVVMDSLIVELAELATFGRSSNEHLKSFLSATSSRFRKAYARRESEVEHGFVVIGTTNEAEFLRDPTGNRRFWPVVIPRGRRVDVPYVEQNLPQLYAEALVRLESGEFAPGLAGRIERDDLAEEVKRRRDAVRRESNTEALAEEIDRVLSSATVADVKRWFGEEGEQDDGFDDDDEDADDNTQVRIRRIYSEAVWRALGGRSWRPVEKATALRQIGLAMRLTKWCVKAKITENGSRHWWWATNAEALLAPAWVPEDVEEQVGHDGTGMEDFGLI